MNVILRDGVCPDGAELTRLKEQDHVVVHAREDGAEPINWALRKVSGDATVMISIPGDDWERIFGGR